MKRFTASVVMTMVLALSAYTFSSAQQPGRGQRGDGAGRPGGPGGRGGVMAVLRGIELTEEQRTAIRALVDEGRTAGAPAEADNARQLHRQLQAEVFADSPDAAKIAALQEQLSRAQAERLARQVALQQRIAELLTSDQRRGILNRRP